MDEEELTGADYVNEPLVKLMRHPDYSPHAHRVIEHILRMTSAQIEDIKLTGDN